MPKVDNAVLVVGSGNFYVAPTGTVLPESLTSPASPWESIGHTSLDDIISFTSEGGDVTTLGTLQSKALRSTIAPRVESFGIQLMQFDRRSLRLYYGANAVMLSDGQLAIPQSPQPTQCAFLAVFIDGDNHFAIHAQKAEIFRSDDVAVSDAESLVALPLNVKPLVYSTNDYTYTLTPLGGILATGATAGTPGSFTPTGADAPYDLAAMAGVTASPSTAWTTGQSVITESGAAVHWSGTAWAADAA